MRRSRVLTDALASTQHNCIIDGKEKAWHAVIYSTIITVSYSCISAFRTLLKYHSYVYKRPHCLSHWWVLSCHYITVQRSRPQHFVPLLFCLSTRRKITDAICFCFLDYFYFWFTPCVIEIGKCKVFLQSICTVMTLTYFFTDDR